MKTIYELRIRSIEHLPANLSEIISNLNAGKGSGDMDMLEAYICAENIRFPNLRKDVLPVHHTNIGLIEVIEKKNGENVLLYSIEQKFIEELVTNEENKTELN